MIACYNKIRKNTWTGWATEQVVQYHKQRPSTFEIGELRAASAITRLVPIK